MSTGLRTVSLRRRVTVVVTVVLALVVLVLVVAVDRVFAAQTARNLDGLLAGRVQLARQLARSGVGPQQIVNRVAVTGVDVTLTLRDGTVFGEPPASGAALRSRRATLVATGRVDGAVLELSVDTDLAQQAQRTLRRTLIIAGLGAVLLAALLVALATRYALAPLATMAGLARRIADGRRGDRLAPTRTDTELGRTAAAFDDMVDALESSEARTRAFLADAAHELRTPVAGVQAAAETLLHQGDLSTEDRERLEVLLVREARRAGVVITDLLASARTDAAVELRREPVDLAASARAEADRAGSMVTVHGESGELDLDRDKITGVLRNLVDNAARAAGPDGQVMIMLRRGPDRVELMITDSGSGVPTADREAVFDRLVRLDPARATPGTGLGLPIARGWAEAHGGTLTCIDPPPGAPVLGGATFLLVLPCRNTM